MKFGGGSGMSSPHHSLITAQFSVWRAWTDMGCWADGTPSWQGRKVAGDHYETVQGSMSC
jgi:hypothetical protein